MQASQLTAAARSSLLRPENRLALPTLVVMVLLGCSGVALGAVLLVEYIAPVRAVAVLAGLVLLFLGLELTLTRLLKRPVQMAWLLSVSWLAVIAFLAVFADVLPFKEAMNPGKTLLEPAMASPDLLSGHPLGTDRHGLDLLGGLAYGARVSLTVGLGATVLGGLVGVVIGLMAGYLRGRFDAIVGLMTDSMLAFPPLILLLAVVAVLKPSVFIVTCALGLLTVPGYTRLARAHTLALAPREFVLTARAMGAKRSRIILHELFPNVFWPLVSYSIIVVAAMIVSEASLSYLGLSVQRPTPTWGNMIAAGQDAFQSHPHLVLVPGTVMFLTVLALNSVGEKLQSRFSGTERNR